MSNTNEDAIIPDDDEIEDGEFTGELHPDDEPFDPALVNPLGREAQDSKDAMVIGRARITAAIANREKERLEAAKANDCNIDIQQVNRYQAQWDASVIFRGFSYRLVMVKHPEVMRMYSKVSEVEEKLLEHLSEDDFHIGENPKTDDYEVYLKSPAVLFLWKMNCPEWMAVNFDRIEQHTD